MTESLDGRNDRLTAFFARFSGTAYGGDYNPEQWPRAVWDEDIRLMREANVGLVTVAVFGWGLLEPEEGRYDFDWLDEALDHLHANGIAVDLATATASPPAWMATGYPESLPIDERGVRAAFGGRAQFSPSSAVYRAAAAALVERMAERYAHHPAVAMWHIGNEYSGVSYDAESAAAFRKWLAVRYGSVEALNQAWGTRVWAQTYQSFEQVNPPSVAPSVLRNPAHRLDFARFTSDAYLECYLMEAEILRRITPNIPITTNFMADFKHIDYWKWSEHVDVVALDSYPDPANPDAAVEAAFAYDLTRSQGGGGPWLLMEQAVNAVNWREINVSKPAGLMRLWSYQAIARGAASVLAFQWRTSRSGAEKFHSSMLPHSGPFSRVWSEVVKLGQELSSIPGANLGLVTARVAIVFSYENWWAIEQGNLPRRMSYLADVRDMYQAFWSRNIPVDFVSPGADLSGYRLVCVPQLYLAGVDVVASWEQFVTDGGHLIATYASALVDDSDTLHAPGFAPELANLCGLRIEEISVIDGDDAFEVNYVDGNLRVRAGRWLDLTEVTTGTVLASVTTSARAGAPAVIRNTLGRGTATYVATRLHLDGWDALIHEATTGEELGIGFELPANVEAVVREGAAGTTMFLLNHGDVTATVNIGRPGYELLSGSPCHDVISIEPNGVAVIRC